MGCDGGTIPRRDELVRTKKKQEQKDRNSELNFRWRCCSISQEPLDKPIVACGLGRLYSKTSVITALLDKTTLPASAKHLKSLKDVKELNLTENPAFKPREDDKGDGYVDHQTAPFICPIIGLEANGKFKFVFHWSCGCVLSDRAVKEIKSDGLCHKCQNPIDSEDLVVLNASGDDLAAMEAKMIARQAKLRSLKKSKKALPGDNTKDTSDASNLGSVPSTSVASNSQSTSGGTFSRTGSLYRVVDKSISYGLKRGESLGMQAPDLKKAKSNYSVAKDGEASQVYKSIFTSSKKAQNQDRAHWITYNPFYN